MVNIVGCLLDYFHIMIFSDIRTNVCPGEKEKCRMSAKEELLSYITSLTPEQVDKAVSQLPRLISILEESYQPCLREQFLQNQ